MIIEGRKKSVVITYIWGRGEEERSDPAMVKCRHNTIKTIG